MSKVKGLVLCGGIGSRLWPITYYFQKAMMPVGLKQKPLLEYVVRLLKFHGISDLTFLVDYKAEQIVNYFDDGSRFGVKISYVKDDPELKGTAGSIINAYRQGVVGIRSTLLVYYGDILTNIDVTRLVQHHEDVLASATVALATSFTIRVGKANLDKDGRIRRFVEKPKLRDPVSVGLVVLKGETLKDMEQIRKEKGELDLMGNVIPYLIKIGKPVHGYLSDAFWYDVGSIGAYETLDHTLIADLLSHLF